MKKIFAAFSISVIILAGCFMSNSDENQSKINKDSFSESSQPSGTNVNEPSYPRI